MKGFSWRTDILRATIRTPGAFKRHGEPAAVLLLAGPDAAVDVDLVGEGRRRVHRHHAIDDDAAVRLLDQAGAALLLGAAEAVGEGRAAGGEGHERAGVGNHLVERLRDSDALGRLLDRPDAVDDAEGDEGAVAGRVGKVAGALEGDGRDRAAEAADVVDGLRDLEGEGAALAGSVRRGQEEVCPLRVVVAVVPGGVLINLLRGRGMSRDVLDLALAHDPELAPVSQGFFVLGAGSHLVPLPDEARSSER